MSEFSWLHFSDLHSSDIDSNQKSNLQKALLSSLKKYNFECNYIFFTGDIADKNNYTTAKNLILDILSNIRGVYNDFSNVFWAVGNHDINQDLKLRNTLIERIYSEDPPSLKFREFMSDNDTRKVLVNLGMKNYIKYTNNIFKKILTPKIINDTHVYYQFDDCNIIVLNTCLTSYHSKKDSYNLLLIDKRLEQIFNSIQNKDKKPLIVIGHHGIDEFQYIEKDYIQDMFQNAEVDFYLCGHNHKVKALLIKDKPNIYQISCGSQVAKPNIISSFMYGTFNSETKNVKIIPYSYGFSSDRQFFIDNRLDPQLSENNYFEITRLNNLRENNNIYFSFATITKNELFERSKIYYETLIRQTGKLHLNTDEKLIPSVKSINTFVSESGDSRVYKLLDILSKNKKLLIVGEGGMGKTVALLYLWMSKLKEKGEYLPLYIPLNEYKGEADFIHDFIYKNYSRININNLNIKFMLLLDGLNETTGTINSLIIEILSLLSSHTEQISIIITSRNRLLTEQFEKSKFSLYHLQPLPKNEIINYLMENNIVIVDLPFDIICVPMMLTLYTQILQMQKQNRFQNVYNLLPSIKRGALIYNYILYQCIDLINKKMLGDFTFIWYTLFIITPSIAYDMIYSDTAFRINKDKFRKISNKYLEQYSNKHIIDQIPIMFHEMIKNQNNDLNNIISVEDILIYNQDIVEEDNEYYYFRHQYFRDFFASLHIYNQINNYINNNTSNLPIEISEKLWPNNICEMLGDIIEDHKNSDFYNGEETILHKLVNKIRNVDGKVCKFTIYNIILTWCIARNYKIINENLNYLDLRHIQLNGILFSSTNGNTSFKHSKISLETFLPRGHYGSVNNATYNEKYQCVLTASSDGLIREWNINTGECIQIYKGHTSGVTKVLYNENGEQILSCSWDSTIREWDRNTGKCICIHTGHVSMINAIAYSPDGKYILSGANDKTIKLWRQGSKNCVETHNYKYGRVDCIKYNKNGDYILVATADNIIREIDLKTYKVKHTYKGHKDGVTNVSYNKMENCILSASDDRTIIEWNRETCKPIHKYIGHKDIVYCVKYNNDESCIISGSDDRTIREWKINDENSKRIFTGSKSYIRYTTYIGEIYKKEKFILSVSHNGTIMIWDESTGECIKTINGNACIVNNAIYCNNDQYVIVITSENIFKEWDKKNKIFKRIFVGHKSPINNAVYNAVNQKLISMSTDGEIRIWNYITSECEKVIKDQPGSIFSAVISVNGLYLLSASNNYKIKEWNIKTGECINEYTEHSGCIKSISCSKDEKYILSTSADNTIKLWDKNTGKNINTFKGHTDIVNSAIFNNDETKILSASWDYSIREWDKNTGECIKLFQGHSSGVNCASYSKDNRYILSASEDGTIKEYYYATGECKNTYSKHSDAVKSAVYSEDGKSILSSSADNTIKEWNCETGKVRWTTPRYGGIYINDCSFYNCYSDKETNKLLKNYGGCI